MLWKIPVTWEMYACINVDAPTLDEAMKIVEDPDEEIPLPSDGSYVDRSWRLASTTRDEIAALQSQAPAMETSPSQTEQADTKLTGIADEAPIPMNNTMDKIIAYRLPGFYIDARGVYGILVCSYYISCSITEAGQYDVELEAIGSNGTFSKACQPCYFDTAKDAVNHLCRLLRVAACLFKEDLEDDLSKLFGGN